MNESMQAEAVSVSLIGTLRDVHKCMEETLHLLRGSATEERPKVAPTGKTLFEQAQMAQGLAGGINDLAHEVCKACHAMQLKLGE